MRPDVWSRTTPGGRSGEIAKTNPEEITCIGGQRSKLSPIVTATLCGEYANTSIEKGWVIPARADPVELLELPG
jgi:hypothetical protein